MPRAFAIAAHPDDIEFMMAGALLLLRAQGWETHYMNVASGSCGSMTLSPARARATRRKESQAAARVLGATWWPSLVDDLEVFYEPKTLRRLAAIIREVNPTIVLTHSPQDYMEDHANTARLAVTATFAKGFPNFKTTPARPPVTGEVTLYHAMPHGLCGPLREAIEPDFFINTATVQTQKRAALAAHASQKEWLDATQGMDSYLNVMDDFAQQLGRRSKKFTFAEGWRKRLHYGFCGPHADPLYDTLAAVAKRNPNAF